MTEFSSITTLESIKQTRDNVYEKLHNSWEEWKPDATQEKSPVIDFLGLYKTQQEYQDITAMSEINYNHLSNWNDTELLQKAGFDEVTSIDLHTLGPLDIVYFTGAFNNAAYWTIKRDGENIKLWRDYTGRSTALVTAIDNIAVSDQTTYDRNTDEETTYHGVLFAPKGLLKRPQISLPYFTTDVDGNTLPPIPGKGWHDNVTHIFVKRATTI